MTFQTDAMNCGGCTTRVIRTLQTVEPAAEVDLDRRLVEVRSQEPSTAFAAALAQVDYPAVAVA